MKIIKTKGFTLGVNSAGLALALVAIFMGYGMEMALVVGALLIHEGFHVVAMALLGVQMERIELTPFGGVADVESFQGLPPAWQVCIALSGVIGSFFCYFVLGLLPEDGQYLEAFRQMNLMLGCFNLLPMLPLDGARALGAIGDQFSFGRNLRKAMMGLAFLASAVMLAAAAYGAWHGHVNVTLMFTAPYLCYAARQAYVTQQVRLVEERLRMSAKLRRGGAWKVDGIAIHSGGSKGELLKWLLALPGSRLHYFFLINPDSGKVERVLAESEAIEEILGDR